MTSTAAPAGAELLVVVNAHASGVEEPRRAGVELAGALRRLGSAASHVETASEAELRDALAAASDDGRRVVLVGGDGSVHAAANARLEELPELALVPSGRANNIARGLGIPVRRDDALPVAARAAARRVDLLHVQALHRSIYAVEALSGGFQAAARDRYGAENSGDLRQGLGALVRGVRNYAPYAMRVAFDDGELATTRGAQLFVSNLPLFGFGFRVDPGADPGDGRLEITMMEAIGRRRLLFLLAAAYRGQHVGRRGVQRASSTRAVVLAPLPLVADTVALGTTTATVTVARGRLRVAAP